METIALIASVISAVTAVTTALRALGKSVEYHEVETEKARKIIFPYKAVTAIWFVLAVIFAVPSLSKSWANGENTWLLVWTGFFLVIIVLLFIIWKRIGTTKK